MKLKKFFRGQMDGWYGSALNQWNEGYFRWHCFSPWPTQFPALKVFIKHKVGDGQHED